MIVALSRWSTDGSCSLPRGRIERRPESGSFERQGDSLRLHAERWVSIRSGAPTYTRNRVITARLTASTLTVDGEEWPVVALPR